MTKSAVTVIAIDGPAASGKGTLARQIARHYDYAYLDTGSLYRATGLAVLAATRTTTRRPLPPHRPSTPPI